MTRFTAAQILDIKERNRVDDLAARLVTLRNGRADRKFPHGKQVGPCPFCSKNAHSKTDSRFECDGEKWVCGACADGGDIIAFVAKERGLNPHKDFVAILEQLGGARPVEDTPQSARRAGAKAFNDGKPNESWPLDFPPHLRADWARGWGDASRAAAANERYRSREIVRLHDNYWMKACAWRGTPVESYFEKRKLMVPPYAHIRFLADCPYHEHGGEQAEVIHRGPVMLCAIYQPDAAAPRGSRFTGLHFTYIDLAQPKAKATIISPSTGEVLPSKKARGSKQGGYIDLGGCDWREALMCIGGEGVENTCAGYTLRMIAGKDVSHINFRCAIDLGNLAGKALDRLNHPTLKTAAGAVRKVPGDVPDMTSPAMPLPPQTQRMVWMCDSDSDPFITRAAMRRTIARHARDDLKQVLMWPGIGDDWNDVVR